MNGEPAGSGRVCPSTTCLPRTGRRKEEVAEGIGAGGMLWELFEVLPEPGRPPPHASPTEQERQTSQEALAPPLHPAHFPCLLWKPPVVAPRADKSKGEPPDCKDTKLPNPKLAPGEGSRESQNQLGRAQGPLAFASKVLSCPEETVRFREGKTPAPDHTASLDALSEVSKSCGLRVTFHLLGPGTLCGSAL